MAHNRISNDDFLKRVREYLPMDAAVWSTDNEGKPSANALCGALNENTFYIFDAEALLAVSQAIEDLALDEASGCLLAAFPDHTTFEPLKDKYWQLGATLDEVLVVLPEHKSRRQGRLRYVMPRSEALASCWSIVYQGRRAQGSMFCRRINHSPSLEEEQFLGFYTLNPTLIERVRADLAGALTAECPEFSEFQRLKAIDQSAKKLRDEFAREHQALEAALQKLQTGGDRYQSRHFEADLERSLDRLEKLKESVPRWLAL